MKNIVFTVLKIFIILIFVAFILEEYFVVKEYKNDDQSGASRLCNVEV